MKKQRPVLSGTFTRPPRINVDGLVDVHYRLSGEPFGAGGGASKLSTNGMRVQCARPLPPGAACDFRIDMADAPLSLEGAGWVVFANEDSMAIQFDDDVDPEFTDHLMRYLSRHVDRSENA
ncbi:MAG: PilZ domain-containing protein [Nitrospirota bacterium]|nr:PilZ domain-containing protein [Nitrospirota bacterium]